MKKYKIEDIKENCLVILKKNNEYKKIFVTDVLNNCIFYDTYDSYVCLHKSQLADDKIEIVKIIDLKEVADL